MRHWVLLSVSQATVITTAVKIKTQYLETQDTL
jgi:hypothetical protein